MSSPSNFLGSHVVVIGGGMAGLLSAHVLTRYFERVSLIERDSYPEKPVFRAGTPQGRHVQTILIRGQQILEEFFPGLKDKLIAHGAVESDFMADYIYRFPSGWASRTSSRLKGFSCSRPLLEWLVRQEVITCKRIQIIEKHEVVNLLTSNDRRSITGVQMRARNSKAYMEHELLDLPADLVVDTSGRDSHVLHWFKAIGYTPPPETVINPFFGYSSRQYIPSVDYKRTWKAMLVQALPPQDRRGILVLPIEGNNWLVVLAGTGKDYPPTDETGFLDFIKSIPDPTLHEALQNAQPSSSIYGYRRTESRLRHFEQLTRLPAGFVALGDAVCAFNPVHGQGTTAAALGVKAFDACLRQQHQSDMASFPYHFQRKLAKVNELPWQWAKASDYYVPGIEGMQLKRIEELTYRYLGSVIGLLPTAPSVNKTFIEVKHMVKAPIALLHPSIVAKVLLHKFSH